MRRLWKKAVRRGEDHSDAATPSSDGSLNDSAAAKAEDRDSEPKENILLGPLRSSLPWAGTEDNENPVSSESLMRLQREVGLWARITWAHHRKDDLEKCVSDIASTVTALQNFLTLRVLEKPQKLLLSRSTPPQNTRVTIDDQQWLKDLHLSLCSLQKRSTAPSSGLSIALLEDGKQLWQQVKDDLPGLPLKDAGLMLWAQLENKDKPTLSTFLMIESAESKSAPNLVLKRLSQPDLPKTESDVFGDFRMWGSPPPSLKNSNLSHSIFAEQIQWQRKLTLRDIIQHAASATFLTRSVVTELTYQLLLGFKRLILINATCTNLRSDNIAYYRPAADEIDFNEPDWLLHPYVNCGFGRPTPERRLGVQSGPLKDPDASIIEIGLVLFQIGSRRVVEYDARSARIMPVSLVQKRREALNNLNLIERWNGAQFANIVSACLQAKAENALEVVEAAFATLVDVRNSIDTVDEVFLDSEVVPSASERVMLGGAEVQGIEAQEILKEKGKDEPTGAEKSIVEEVRPQKSTAEEVRPQKSGMVEAGDEETPVKQAEPAEVHVRRVGEENEGHLAEKDKGKTAAEKGDKLDGIAHSEWKEHVQNVQVQN